MFALGDGACWSIKRAGGCLRTRFSATLFRLLLARSSRTAAADVLEDILADVGLHLVFRGMVRPIFLGVVQLAFPVFKFIRLAGTFWRF